MQSSVLGESRAPGYRGFVVDGGKCLVPFEVRGLCSFPGEKILFFFFFFIGGPPFFLIFFFPPVAPRRDVFFIHFLWWEEVGGTGGTCPFWIR